MIDVIIAYSIKVTNPQLNKKKLNFIWANRSFQYSPLNNEIKSGVKLYLKDSLKSSVPEKKALKKNLYIGIFTGIKIRTITTFTTSPSLPSLSLTYSSFLSSYTFFLLYLCSKEDLSSNCNL